MNISKYNDIMLEKSDYNSVKVIQDNDTEVKYDWFDNYAQNSKKSEIYNIINQHNIIGYIALYDIDSINKSICVYSKISAKNHYGDLLKSMLSVMDYVFEEIGYNKIIFIYREDNYFFEDMCRFLYFIKEGVIRNQLLDNGKHININVYGMLAYEYVQHKRREFKKIFTWDNNYSASDYVVLDIADKFNCRSFTNSLDNPNNALMNDWLYEFALNRAVNENDWLEYKEIKFPVKIFDMDSQYDSLICQGQVIDVPENKYKDILFIATAQFGYKDTYIELIYSDESSKKVRFTISDWCERVLRDEYIIHYAYGCRQMGWKSNIIKCDSYLYLKKLSIESNKLLKAIKLPVNPDIIIYSIALTGSI